MQVIELQPIHTSVCKEGMSNSYHAGHALGIKSRGQTQPLGTLPHPGTLPASPRYQWLLVLVGLDAADKVGLAVGQNSHQLLQRLLELACQGDGALGGV